MALLLYMDEHVDAAITRGLRARGIDVLTAQEDGYVTTPDTDLLDRATALGRVVVTKDADFLTEAQQRQTNGIPFAGVVYAHQLGPSVGLCIRDLELIATVYESADMENRVEYLPL
jgi:predicted nuclease of predicted toxin-antitoxin system